MLMSLYEGELIMSKTMVVVADSAYARIFTVETLRSPLNEIEVMAHPESRLHERDITSDLPGKDSGTDSSGGHAYGGKVDAKSHELIVFAKQVATYLDGARKANKLARLLIVAAPEFLGELRSQLSGETNDKVVFELNKNLTKSSPDDISKYLPKSLSH